MSVWPKVSVIADDVNSGKLSASDLVDKALGLIDDKSEYQAIISKTAERAKRRAIEVDSKVKSGGQAGRLAGVPFIAKDNFLAFGGESTAASNMLRGFNAPYQATAIEKLEAEGAICVAKANLDAFAHGTSTENSDFFTTYNPYDKSRVAGGSSGGPAASVALDMTPFALGTDTGGSIRLPASFCGVVGYKPTYGLVSRSGVVAMASSTDTIGALANNVSDVALVMEIMGGRDKLDSTTIKLEDNNFTSDEVPSGQLKIGVVKEYFSGGLQDSVKAKVLEAVDKLDKNGAIISEISLPSLPLALAVYYILCPAEISSNLSRYDGQRYGYFDKQAKPMEDSYYDSRSKGFGAEAKRRIIIGTYVLSSGYYDAYYKQAQTVRTKLVNEFNEAFKKVDYLVGPTTATPAFKAGEFTSDPLAMYLNDIMTVGPSLVGIPAISLPVGQVDGLPVGMQLMAAQKHDKELLGYARSIEELINV